MVDGIVIANTDGNLEAFVSLTLQGFAGQEETVDFLIDTGFSGELGLPNALIFALNLPMKELVLVTLANSSEYEAITYTGVVGWNGIDRLVSVLGGEDDIPLLGMGLLQNHDVQMRVVENGAVQILPVPNP